MEYGELYRCVSVQITHALYNMAANRAGKGGPDTFGGEVLAAHNAYRSKHGAPALQWSREAAEAANRWAARLASIGKISFSEKRVCVCSSSSSITEGRLEHDHDSGMGQNLYQKTVIGTTLEIRGQEVVDSWYGEIRNYDYSRPGFSSGTGHFTQVTLESLHA